MLLYSTQLLDPNVFIDFPNDARVVAVFTVLVSSKWSALSTLRTIVHFLPNYVKKYQFVKVIEAFQDSDAFLISQQQYCYSCEWHQSCRRKRFRCWKHWDVLKKQRKHSCMTKLQRRQLIVLLRHWLKDWIETTHSSVKFKLKPCWIQNSGQMWSQSCVPPMNQLSHIGQHHVIRGGHAFRKMNRCQLMRGNMVVVCFSLCWPFIRHDAQGYCIAMWILCVVWLWGSSLHFFSSPRAEVRGHHTCIFQVCMQK